jgi:hypothetical protein
MTAKMAPAKPQRPSANTLGVITPGAHRATTILMVQNNGINQIKNNAKVRCKEKGPGAEEIWLLMNPTGGFGVFPWPL